MVALAVVAALHTAAIIAFSLFLALIIHSAIEGEGTEVLLSHTLWFGVAVAVRAVSLAALNSIAQRGGARIKSELRRVALGALRRLGPAYMDRASSSEITTLLSSGIDALDNYFGKYLPQLFLTAVQMPIILAALWIADIPTGIAITIALPVIPLFMVLIGWATQAVQKGQWEGMQRLARSFLDLVEGLPTLKIFGRQWRQVGRIREVTNEFRVKTMAVLRVSFLSSFVLELAASLSVAIVAVSIGIRLIDGTLPLWLGLYVLILIPELYLPLRNVGAQFHQAADGLAAAEDLFAIIETPTPDAAAAPAGSTVARGAWELKGLAARRDGRVVHQPISLTLEPGKTLAISGPSGVGKSSLVDALLGFIDHDGQILIGGEPTTGPLRRELISWVAQKPQLFQGSIADNVTLGDPHPDLKTLTWALSTAGLAEVDPSMGLGVWGAGLSGGQSQRLSLARALYRHRRGTRQLLVLDEVTSALDAETEKVIWSGVTQVVTEGAIALVISHRETILNQADTVVSIAPSKVSEVTS